MCGRFAMPVDLSQVEKLFFVEEYLSEVPPSWNIAPSQKINTIVPSAGGKAFQSMTWNFLPAWAYNKEPGSIKPMINARSETVMTKPSFKEAFTSGRCIIPATGYYEWQKSLSEKQPFYIYSTKTSLLAMAGIFQPGPEGFTVAILTRNARPDLQQIHPRMPLFIPSEDISLWLSPAPAEEMFPLFTFSGPALAFHPVSPQMNNPSFNSPHCIAPL